MTRPQALVWSLLLLLAGGALLVYLLRATSPLLADGALNQPLVVLFFIGLFGFFAGGGVLAALVAHWRWPTLGGGAGNRSARGDFALRQGLILGAALVAIALLAFFQMIDLIYIVVILLIAGLLETYWQQRSPKSTVHR